MTEDLSPKQLCIGFESEIDLYRAIDKIAKRQNWDIDFTFVQIVRHGLGQYLPGFDRVDMELIIKGAPIE